MVGVLVASLVSSVYIVFFTKVHSKEGFNKPGDKPNKYNFLENKIEVNETPVVTPPVKRKFISDLVISKGKRPPLTKTGLVKLQKGAHDGLGFNTGAIN